MIIDNFQSGFIIRCRYFGPTNFRGYRVQAYWRGRKVTIANNNQSSHIEAVYSLIYKVNKEMGGNVIISGELIYLGFIDSTSKDCYFAVIPKEEK